MTEKRVKDEENRLLFGVGVALQRVEGKVLTSSAVDEWEITI